MSWIKVVALYAFALGLSLSVLSLITTTALVMSGDYSAFTVITGLLGGIGMVISYKGLQTI